jgi:hypothetical protein
MARGALRLRHCDGAATATATIEVATFFSVSLHCLLIILLFVLIMSGRRASSSTNIGQVPVDLNDQMAVLKFCGMFVAAMTIMKVLYNAMFALWIVAFPLIYIYAVQQCPSDASFDAKKELKRVLRG